MDYKLKNGLYEQVINEAIDSLLPEIVDSGKLVDISKIDEAEASKVLADYVAGVIEKELESVKGGEGRLEKQVALVNEIVKSIAEKTKDDETLTLSIAERGEQLMGVFDKKDPRLIANKTIVRPETSLSHSSLFTGAVYEPQIDSEFNKEIKFCNRIDMVVSFIKWSGLRLIIDNLKDFTNNGGELRIITTSYLGATDIRAIEELNKLNNTKIKVSYDTKRTRLHAKAYIFYRDTGFTTAYVGSSNMSNPAMTSGLEWNVKITQRDLPETIEKIEATFESYWSSKDFEYYDEGQYERLKRALTLEKGTDNATQVYTVDVKPYSYQEEILDKLETERTVHGRYRNLIVAATGTGKTIISAFDYKRFVKENPKSPNRLLFIAHREEILKQSISAFRSVLKDANFGELYVGKYIPENIDHIFMSIQTFNSKKFHTRMEKDFYDYIIVDEFHHSAASSYREVLNYYEPKIMLGLTATPERMDGKNVLEYFGNRIAAEIRLPEAIERKLLCPFQYFGVTDTVDLTDVKWTRGGYDITELSNVYSLEKYGAKKRADMIIEAVLKYVTDINDVKGLGFCVSKKHAGFMSDYFNDHGIPSISLDSESPTNIRRSAAKRLASGEIKFIFVVDLYNEGVDIPEVNTILFLRPTESLTVFLQQLGRGLRLADDKECLTVLDFIGQANKKYRFEERFEALLANTRNGVQREIENGFVSLPKGCHIKLEKYAAKYILDNIRASLSGTNALVEKVRILEEDAGLEVTLANFLDYNKLHPQGMYRYSTFTRLCERANVYSYNGEVAEEDLNSALRRFSTIDSRRWIKFILDILPNLNNLDVSKMTDMEKRMMQMFYATIWQKGVDNWNDSKVKSNLKKLADSPTLVKELEDLLRYQYEKIDFVDQEVDLGFECPLDVYCTYTRDQLLVAMDYLNPTTMREGVKWLAEKKLDIFLVTLNKTDKLFSETTMYNDYSINNRLFHWQSQSTTSDSSPTGLRYINHKKEGSKVLLFVRESKSNMYKETEAYTFLGTAEYLSHKGSRPMSIVWKMDYEIPAKYLKKTNKLMVG